MGTFSTTLGVKNDKKLYKDIFLYEDTVKTIIKLCLIRVFARRFFKQNVYKTWQTPFTDPTQVVCTPVV